MDSPARWVPPRDIPGGWRAHTVNGTVGFTPGEGLAPSLQTPAPPRTPVLGPPKPSWPRCSHGPQPRPPQASFLDRRVNEVERARSVTKDEAFTSFWLHTGQPGSPSFSELRWKSLCFGVKSAPPHLGMGTNELVPVEKRCHSGVRWPGVPVPAGECDVSLASSPAENLGLMVIFRLYARIPGSWRAAKVIAAPCFLALVQSGIAGKLASLLMNWHR